MTDTDKDLLERAARAAGLKIDADGLMPIDRDRLGLLILNDKGGHTIWSPLTDDGDALRLAVKLRIAIRLDDDSAVSAGWSKAQSGAPTIDGKGPWFWKEWINGEYHNNGDTYIATRRAIVRAAAAIGDAK